MATYKRRTRSRGRVEQLPSGSLRAVVYAGTDPLTGRRHFLREVIPAGPKAADEAEKAVRRLAAQVDERKHPRTNATLDQLLDRYLETLDVAESTRQMYAKYAEKHIRPFVGRLKAGAVDVEVLDSLHAELRRCRIHCNRSRGLVDHRTQRPHECDSRCRFDRPRTRVLPAAPPRPATATPAASTSSVTSSSAIHSGNLAGGSPPFSARHRQPVLRPIPTRRQASMVPTPAASSDQYSDSISSLRLRPRLAINTPFMISSVATSTRTHGPPRGQSSEIVDTTPPRRSAPSPGVGGCGSGVLGRGASTSSADRNAQAGRPGRACDRRRDRASSLDGQPRAATQHAAARPLRQYFPKRTDLSVHTTDDLRAVQDRLNDRPRKGLGWRTPTECFEQALTP